MIDSSMKMNACSSPVTSPRNIIGSGTRNGTMLKSTRMTSSSPKMLPNSRSDSDSSRDVWLMISIGNIRKPSMNGAPGGAQKCLTYPTIPCARMPW